MNIFYKRPLSLILCIMLGAFVFFSIGQTVIRLTLVAISLLLSVIYIVSIARRKGNPLLIISSFAILLSMLLSYVYFDTFFKSDKIIKGEHEYTALITDSSSASYYTLYTAKTLELDGEKFTNRKLLISLDNDDAMHIAVGDTVRFRADLSGFENTADFNAQAFYYSEGIGARADVRSEIEVISQDETPSEISLRRIRQRIERRAIMSSDELTGSLVCALLLGERDALSEEVLLDFKRIGIFHLLALSGLHLSILALGLSRILSVLGIKKKPRALITVFAVVLYMAFTGFSVSVVRAGIMLIITSLLFLFSRTHDSVTSLFCAVSLIVLVNPTSIYDISLWLSAFSTLGIIVISEITERESPATTFPSALIRYVKTSILASVFAISACLILSVCTFDAISLISPLSTLIFGVLAEIILLLGVPMILFGSFIPIERILSPICVFTKDFANMLSSPEWVYVYADSVTVKIAVLLFSIIFYCFIIFKFKRKRIAVCAICLSFVLIHALALISSQSARIRPGAIYASNGTLDTLVLRSCTETALVNLSGDSYYSGNASLDTLHAQELLHIDKYCITEYSWATAAQTQKIISSVKVMEILAPTPLSKDESYMLESLFTTCEKFNTKLKVYSEYDVLCCGDFVIDLDYATPHGVSPAQKALRLYCGDHTCTYISPGALSAECPYPTAENIKTTDSVIFGSGSAGKNPIYIDTFYGRNSKIIISSSNVFYTQEAYTEYIENGCEIYSHPSYVKIYSED